MRVVKFTAKPDWKGIFYIGWSMNGTKKAGISVSLGKKSYLITK